LSLSRATVTFPSVALPNNNRLLPQGLPRPLEIIGGGVSLLALSYQKSSSAFFLSYFYEWGSPTTSLAG